MDISYGRFSLPFKRILYYADSFVVETDSARYRLTCGISEHYILSNLKGSCKKDGILTAELTGHKNQPVLSPIAILHGENTTWIATTEEHPDLPVTSDLSPLAALKVDKGEEYPDGFIDSSRT